MPNSVRNAPRAARVSSQAPLRVEIQRRLNPRVTARPRANDLDVLARAENRTQGDEKSESREVGIEGENSENSIIRSRSALCRFSRGTVGNQLPPQAQGLSVQFSMFNLGTRPNSRVLFVTSVTPRLRAWAAMNRSFAPIIVPRVFKWARIFA